MNSMARAFLRRPVLTGAPDHARPRGVRQIVRAAMRDEWDGLERISRDIRPADIVTMTNALVGLAAILLAVNERVDTAAYLVLAGLLLDGVDGAAARKWGGGPLGGFLDSMADVVTFGVAPAVIVFQHVADVGGMARWAVVAGSGALLLAVLLRLARFEALRERQPTRYFSGLSSPGGAILVVAASLAWPEAIAPVAFVTAVLMVGRVRYPKLKGALGVLAALVVLFAAVTGLGGIPLPSWGGVDLAVGIMSLFMLVYILAGPYYVLLRVGPTPDPEGA